MTSTTLMSVAVVVVVVVVVVVHRNKEKDTANAPLRSSITSFVYLAQQGWMDTDLQQPPSRTERCDTEESYLPNNKSPKCSKSCCCCCLSEAVGFLSTAEAEAIEYIPPLKGDDVDRWEGNLWLFRLWLW